MLPPNRLCLKIQLCVFRADITSSYICNTVCCCILSRLCMTRDKRNVAFVCVCVRDYSSEAIKQASRCTIHTTHITDIFFAGITQSLCLSIFSDFFFVSFAYLFLHLNILLTQQDNGLVGSGYSKATALFFDEGKNMYGKH